MEKNIASKFGDENSKEEILLTEKNVKDENPKLLTFSSNAMLPEKERTINVLISEKEGTVDALVSEKEGIVNAPEISQTMFISEEAENKFINSKLSIKNKEETFQANEAVKVEQTELSSRALISEKESIVSTDPFQNSELQNLNIYSDL